jgi:uncharacterized SAM-binding protein YcdF (DUF218 family)
MRWAAAGVALALSVCATVVFVHAGRFLEVGDALPSKADAIVIMAGSVPDRTLEAADLYAQGIAPRVVVTREEARSGAQALRERGVRIAENHDLSLAALAQLGVPPDAVVLLHRRSNSTESEANTIARWACRHGISRLVVVTSRAHARRARLILRNALGPGIALSLRPTRYDPFRGTRWWHVRRDAKFVWWEYEKLAHYWLREHWSMEPCGGLPKRQIGR